MALRMGESGAYMLVHSVHSVEHRDGLIDNRRIVADSRVGYLTINVVRLLSILPVKDTTYIYSPPKYM